jgi:hypothetical protein
MSFNGSYGRSELAYQAPVCLQKVDIFIMAGKRKQLSNDIKNVIVEMRKSGHKLQEIADTLNIPRGTVSDVVARFFLLTPLILTFFFTTRLLYPS